MSTAIPASRANLSAPQRPSAAPAGGPATGVAIDPVRLLKKYYPLLIGAALAGAVIGTAAHFVLARFAPQYTSTATFAVFPQVVDPRQAGYTAMQQDELNRFIGTQMAMMTSPLILERVLRDAEVERTDWAKQYYVNGRLNPVLAQPELEKALSVRSVPQSTLMRLSMTWRKPTDVQRIVEAVSRVYQEDQRRSTSEDSVTRRTVLTGQITTLDNQLKDLTNQRDRVLQDGNVTDLDAGIATEDIRTQRLNEQYVAAVSNLSSITSRLTNLEKIGENEQVIQFPDEMREAANRDPVVIGLDQQISNYKMDFDSLKRQGFGEQHQTVIAARKRIDAAQQERDETYGRALRKIFDAEKDQLRTSATSLDATLASLKKELDEVNRRKQELVRLRIRLKEIDQEIERKTIERSTTDAAVKQLELVGGPAFDRVKLIVQAQEPKQMSFPKLSILLPLGVVLITGLTAGLVVLREVLDQRVRGPADLSAMARLRLLGIVPDAQEDPSRPAALGTAFKDAPAGVTAESFRVLRSPIVKAMDQGGHKSLLVLAGMPGSGATTVASNLALSSAGVGERVLLIDANMRRPAVHKVYGLSEGPGLGDVLAGTSTLQDSIRPTQTPNVFVLTAGTAANRALPERLASQNMARLLTEAREQFDRIIVDSAPAIVAGDGFALANRVDAVALVVRAMNEKRGLVNRLRGQLGECRGEFLGVIINAVRASAGGYMRGNIKATHEYQHGQQAA